MAFDWGNDINQSTEDAIGRLPQYNSGNFNAATNPRGLAGGGHITNFPAALADTATTANGFKLFADLMAGYANSASGSAANALSAIANLSGTSTSSVLLSTGSKSFSTQAGKTWPAGTLLLFTSDANPTTHWMVAQVTAYSGTALSVSVLLFSGSGSRGDWTIRAAGYPGRAAGIAYIWSTTTTTNPPAGQIRANPSVAAATQLYISETDFDGNALGPLILTWDDSASTIKGRIIIQSVTQPSNFAVFDITANITDNGTWDTIPVSVVATGGTLADGTQVQVAFIPRGDPGTTGSQGPSYVATSTSSVAIATGTKTFTTQAGLAYAAGTRARVTDVGNVSNYMEGIVTAYSGTTLQILVDVTSGSGTIANWNISVAGERGAAGTTGPTGDDAGLEYVFSTATLGDPGTGKFIFNNAILASATQWSISKTDNNGNSVLNLLAALDDGTGTNKIFVLAVKQGGAAYFSFFVTSTLTDSGPYVTFNLTPVSTSGTIVNNDVMHITAIPLQKGDTGTTGAAGPTTAPTWNFDSATPAADPGSNAFRLSSATIGSVNRISINETGPAGANLSAFIDSWDASTNAAHLGTLYITQANDSARFAIFTVGTVTDQGVYDDVALTYVAGPGNFQAGAACAFAFTRTGNAGAGAGDVVGPAGATNNALALFNTGTGKLIKDSIVDLTGTAPNALLAPVTSDNVALGSTTKMWSDLFLASGAVINYAASNVTITHSSGVLTVTAGDFQVTTPGANTASVVTVGATQTLTGKTLTNPVINNPTGITAANIGLGNVDNTSDANKPVSTAQAAINAIHKFISVRCATTANITIASSPKNGDVIDGVTIATGQLVLVKNQSSAAENGVYVAGASSPARHVEYDTYNELAGLMMTVQEGTTLADTLWHCTSNIGGTINVTALTFTQLTGASYTADGTTLTLTGTQFSINLNNANTWLASQTFINSSGILIRDTDASNTLGIILGSNLTANRTLTITPGDASRIITLGGDITTAGSLTLSGSFAATFTLASATNVIFPASGTLATTDASSLTSGTLPDARLSSGATPYGLQTIWIPASSCIARITNGAAAFIAEIGTAPNQQVIHGYDFDTSTAEAIQFMWAMPVQWNENVVAFKVHWTVASGSGGVAFSLKARAASNDDAMAGTWGTAVTVTDTILAANDEHVTAISANVTVGNTPVSEDLVFFELQREVANASDTAAVDARVLGISLYITTDAGHD